MSNSNSQNHTEVAVLTLVSIVFFSLFSPNFPKAECFALGTLHEDNPLGIVTISIGVALASPRPNAEGPENVLREADTRLCRAKHGGKNQICD